MAKALRDFARPAPALVVKGGVLDGALLDARELTVLADLPSREVLLSMFAGALAAPLRNMAGLLKALPQGLAYGLSALIESRAAHRRLPRPAAEAAVEPVAGARAEGATPQRATPRRRPRGGQVSRRRGGEDPVAGSRAGCRRAGRRRRAEPETRRDRGRRRCGVEQDEAAD